MAHSEIPKATSNASYTSEQGNSAGNSVVLFLDGNHSQEDQIPLVKNKRPRPAEPVLLENQI